MITDDMAIPGLVVADDELRRAVAAALAAHGLDGRVRLLAADDGAPAGPRLDLPDEAFRMGVLLDRVRAGSCAVRCRFGPYVLDPRALSLRREDDAAVLIRLTEKERDILMALYAQNGAALDRAALLAAVWGYGAAIETHTLETHIYRLRQKIERDPAAPEFLLTDGAGYVLRRER